MRIKQLDINGRKMRFGERDDLIFIGEENPCRSDFLRAIRAVFCDTSVSMDNIRPENRNIKCVVNSYGTDFTITVKVRGKRMAENQNVFGVIGNYEATCKADFNEKTLMPKGLKALLKCDFKEVFLESDTTREIVFYRFIDDDFEFTNYLIDYYRSFSEQRQNTAMEKFIDEFEGIRYRRRFIGFDKTCRELQLFEENSLQELRVKRFCDFIIANKMNTEIEKAIDCDGFSPVFIENCFNDATKEEAEFYMQQLRGLRRQVFIIENESNPLFTERCDKTIFMEDKND